MLEEDARSRCNKDTVEAIPQALCVLLNSSRCEEAYRKQSGALTDSQDVQDNRLEEQGGRAVLQRCAGCVRDAGHGTLEA